MNLNLALRSVLLLWLKKRDREEQLIVTSSSPMLLGYFAKAGTMPSGDDPKDISE